MIPLMRSDFPREEPTLATVRVHEAYHWAQDDGELTVALRYRVNALLGEVFDAEWLLSLVLDGLPAGSERLYRLNADSVRMRQTRGPAHHRGRSLTGVAVVEAPRRGILKGRFHVWMRQQQYGLFTGWSPPMHRAPTVIVAGDFEAVLDAEKGRAIRSSTEADGLERSTEPPPNHPGTSRPGTATTAPTSQPTPDEVPP
jgi:hypothetical protein